MKKILFVSAVLLGLSSAAEAQQAFQRLSFGIEAGSAGVGVELAVPVSSDRIVLKAGFNAPSLTFSGDFDINMAEVNSSISAVNSNLAAAGLPDRIDTGFDDVNTDVSATINFNTAKAMLEFYPFRKSSFHFTAGVYYGMESSFISGEAVTDKTFWSNYKGLLSEVDELNVKYKDVPGYVPSDISAVRVSAGKRTFEVQEKDGAGAVEAAIKLPKFRPYFGLGFGRSIPKSALSLQFDLGAVYYGTPELSSPNEVAYDAGVPSVFSSDDFSLEDLKFCPVVSLRLVFKIF